MQTSPISLKIGEGSVSGEAIKGPWSGWNRSSLEKHGAESSREEGTRKKCRSPLPFLSVSLSFPGSATGVIGRKLLNYCRLTGPFLSRCVNFTVQRKDPCEILFVA